MSIFTTLLASMFLLASVEEAATNPNQSRLKRPALTVMNLNRSVAFYRDVVGFTVSYMEDQFAVVPNRFDLEMMGLPESTRRRVAILNTAQEPRGFVLQAFEPSPEVATQGRLLLVFQTSDFDGLLQRLKAAGVDVKVAQGGEGARFRELGVRDPDGHSLTFYMLLEED